jgi:hypothetical protein
MCKCGHDWSDHTRRGSLEPCTYFGCKCPNYEKANTEEDRKQAMVEILAATMEVIRVKKEIPSGELYAVLMSSFSLSAYQAILDVLKAARLIRVENHLITWIGPIH